MRRAISAVCSAACLSVFLGASAGHGRTASCGPTRAQTVVADGAARIYRVPAGHGPFGPLYDYDGCTPGNESSQRLARSASSGVIVYGCVVTACRVTRAIRLAGPVAGVIVDLHGVDTIRGALTVRDLAGDRVLHTAHTDWQIPGYGDRLITYVLARSGNTAWATETRGADVRDDWAIHRVIGHTTSILDQGPKVRASSLRLRGDAVEWIDDGATRTASLP